MKRLVPFGVAVFLLSFFQNCSNGFHSIEMSSQPLSTTLQYRDAMQLTSSNSGSKTQLIEKLKYKSCMFNSLLYPAIEDEENYLNLLKRSRCLSLPRAIETWTQPPDFAMAATKIQKIEKFTGRSFSYGMFIAEAIATNKSYADGDGGFFDFRKMCAPGSLGHWGPDTCVPTTQSPEYQRYLRHIIGQALDIGISDFLFGQTDYQDGARLLPNLLLEFEEMARLKGRVAIFGQQPNQNPPASYLNKFDYIVSPVFVGRSIDQVCTPDSPANYCITVLFHPDVARKAKNVIVEFDWSSADDDIHRFARLSSSERLNFLTQRLAALRKVNAGMVMPFRIPLNDGSSPLIDGTVRKNCFGINQWVYSSSNQYSCKDEGLFDKALTSWDLLINSVLPPTNGSQIASSCKRLESPLTASATRADKIKYSYCLVLKREADEAGLRFYEKTSEPITDILKSLLMSEEMKNKFYAGMDYKSVSVDVFVESLYKHILNRSSDRAGKSFWINEINSKRLTRDQVLNNFLRGSEFRTKFGSLVQ